MNALIIGIDVDDVCNNLMETVCEIFSEETGYKLDYSSLVEWDLSKAVPADLMPVMMKQFNNKDLIATLKPASGSQSVIKSLMDDEDKVYFLTATSAVSFPWKVEWLKAHYGINENQAVLIRDKWMFNADIMFDDRLETLKNNALWHRICFDRPWNQQDKERDDLYGIVRVSNWVDFYDAVAKIKKMEV